MLIKSSGMANRMNLGSIIVNAIYAVAVGGEFSPSVQLIGFGRVKNCDVAILFETNLLPDVLISKEQCDGDHRLHRLMLICNSIYFCFPMDHTYNPPSQISHCIGQCEFLPWTYAWVHCHLIGRSNYFQKNSNDTLIIEILFKHISFIILSPPNTSHTQSLKSKHTQSANTIY